MTNVIKHAIRYQEYLRSVFVNLMGKDDFGRHRGQVLYGMQLSPIGTSVRIRPGAIVTAYGTKFIWDVVSTTDPSKNTIDLSLLEIGGEGIFNAINDEKRPIVVAISARLAPDEAARQPKVEAEEDMSSGTLEFHAQVVAHSRATSHPTLHLPPFDPVYMDEPQTGPSDAYDYLKTWDKPSQLATVAHLAGNPSAESLGMTDVLLGYVLIGCTATGAPVRTLEGTGGAWQTGVHYVPCRNAHQALADFLGFDHLMGRVDGQIVGPIIGTSTPAYSQSLVQFEVGIGGTAGTTSYQSPKFGTPQVFSEADPWAGSWDDYRPPSFMRDGESLIWQLRRLDYFLRLWMDRTGDQALISLIQDGSHANTKWQSPLDVILRNFTGLDNSNQDSVNLSAIAWPDGTPGPDTPIANHVLKSGVMGHLNRGLSVLSTNYGDTHVSAISALDLGLWHILTDILGTSVDRANLRASSIWTPGSIPGLLHADGPSGYLLGGTKRDSKPTLVQGASDAYLDSENVKDALAHLAGVSRTQGINLLRNATFQAGDNNSQADGNIPHWTLDTASTWTRSASVEDLEAKEVQVTLDGGNRRMYQRIEGTHLGETLLVGDMLGVSVAMRCHSGEVRVRVKGSTAGGAATVFEAQSEPVPVTSTLIHHDFVLQLDSVTDLARIEFIIETTTAADAVVSLAGTWLALGSFALSPALDTSFHGFLSRDGGATAAMRGDLHLGTHQLKTVGAGTEPTDGVNKGQIDAADAARLARAGLATGTPADGTMTGPATYGQTATDFADADQTTTPAAVSVPTWSGVPRPGAADHVVNREHLDQALAGIESLSRLYTDFYERGAWIAGETVDPDLSTPGAVYEFESLRITQAVEVAPFVVLRVKNNLTFTGTGELRVRRPLYLWRADTAYWEPLNVPRNVGSKYSAATKYAVWEGGWQQGYAGESYNNGAGSIGQGTSGCPGLVYANLGGLGKTSLGFLVGGSIKMPTANGLSGAGGGSMILTVGGNIVGRSVNTATEYGTITALGTGLGGAWGPAMGQYGSASGAGGSLFLYVRGNATDLYLNARSGPGAGDNRASGGGLVIARIGGTITNVQTNVQPGGADNGTWDAAPYLLDSPGNGEAFVENLDGAQDIILGNLLPF